MEVEGADGSTITKSAVATGLNFFQAKKERDMGGTGDLNVVAKRNEMMSTTLAKDGNPESQSSLLEDSNNFDPAKDELIDLEKCHTDYRLFHARYDDENIDINDVVNVMLPSHPETSNVLQFELILLESVNIPKDYVVGWGVFPILNSEFEINEGKFKVPLLFGNVNRSFDKFYKIEEQMKKDLDNWLCNIYFEIEKVNLMDVKVDAESDKLFFSPIFKLKRKEKEVTKEEAQDAIHKSSTFLRTKGKTQIMTVSSEDEEDSDKTSEASESNSDMSDHDSFNESSDNTQSIKESKKSKKPAFGEASSYDEDDSFKTDSDIDDMVFSEEKKAGDAIVTHEVNEHENVLDLDFGKSQEDVDYDQYKFAVGMKYDYRSRNITQKKIRYI